MEVPAGLLGVFGRVKSVVAAVGILDEDFAIASKIVAAQEQLLVGGEQYVAILEQATERDPGRVGKGQATGLLALSSDK
jgi:hypothetical protein